MTTTRWSLVLMFALSATARSAPAEDPPAKAPPPKPVVRRLPNSVSKMKVSPDGAWIAAYDWKGAGALFSATGPERRDLPTGDTQQIVFTPDSRFLAVFTETKDDVRKVAFCDAATGAAAHVVDVTGEKGGGEHALSPTHLWTIVPGAEGAQLLFVRSSGMETWDAAKGEQVGAADPGVKNSEYVLTSDRKVSATRTYKGIVVADAATKTERFRIADPEPTGEKAKKGTMVLDTRREIVGFTTDGGLLIVRIEKEVLKDPNALANENMSPEKRLAAIKTTRWIEAFKTADGKSAWKADIDEHTYSGDVVPGAALIAEVEKDALKFRDAATGALKGQFVCGKKLAAVAVSADGRTFWAGTDDGFVLQAK